jgi:large subunit ribosomal protein L24
VPSLVKNKTEKTAKHKIKCKIKRGDKVVVISGKDLGREGKVLHINRADGRLIVEGVNMITKHQKPNRANQTGGIIHREAPIHISNVMYLHKDKPTRIGYKLEIAEINGKREVTKRRYAKTTGEIID